MSPKILLRAVLLWLTVVLLCMAGPAQSAGPQEPQIPADPNQFMHQLVDHEIAAGEADHSHWRYKLHKEDEKGAQDREVIETKDGSIARTLLINGQPLTPEQRLNDEERMKKLVSDPEERARREKRNKQDEDKARQLLKAIPDAFFFKYEGTEGSLTRLSFTPNPKYDPPTRELTVYHSMTGKIWADRNSMRLAKIEGHLIEDVNFGWGLLGHLDKGGTFVVVQQNVGGSHWDAVQLDLNMQGRAVIFKSITVKQKQRLTDFHRMPDDISMDKAFELLHTSESASSTTTQAQK
jgi:hypothetical protein